MFYNHDILNDRKHGIATIWLIATLGAKKSTRKITKKAILDVDVLRSCKTITDPEVPLALRLQGSLLYGVSKVFSQQCGYVLTDTQILRDKMRILSLPTKGSEVDHNVSATRSQQLNLVVDPDFDIDLDLNLESSLFDYTASANERSSQISARGSATSHTSLETLEHNRGLEVGHGSSSSDHVADDFGFEHVSQTQSRISGMPLTHDTPQPELDFADAIDENGLNINEFGEIMLPGENAVTLVGRSSPTTTGPRLSVENAGFVSSDFDIGEPIQKEQAHMSRGSHDPTMSGDFEVGHRSQTADLAHSSQQLIGLSPPEANSEEQEGEQEETEEEQDEVNDAAQRRAAKIKRVPIDPVIELQNRQLADWNNNYLVNMTRERAKKTARTSLAKAKRTVNYLVLDQGLSGISLGQAHDHNHPFAVFGGQALLDLFQANADTRSRKRGASHIEDGSDEDGRRVRSSLPIEEGVIIQSNA